MENITISKAEYEQLLAEQKAKDEQIAVLAFQLMELKRMIFSAKSERFAPSTVDVNQLALFGEAPQETAEETSVEIAAHTRKKKEKKKPVRQKLPEHLPRLRQIVEPDFETEGLIKIGEEINEQLVYKPSELYVLQTVREKFVKKEAIKSEKENQLCIAPMPSQFNPRGQMHISTLAWLVTEKYLYHNPLYRSQSRLNAMGYRAPRSSLSGYLKDIADKLDPLFQLLVTIVLLAKYLQVDETRLEVQTKNKIPDQHGRKKTHRGWLWAYYAVHEKLIFFEYDESRSSNNPMKRLKDYKGKVQTDCYESYDTVYKIAEFIHFHDLAHARRNFEKCQKYNKEKADAVLYVFQSLFALERKAREEDFSEEQILQMRQKDSKLYLEGLFDWMEEEQYKELPSSPLLKAMRYMLTRREKMMYFLSDGSVRMDTNTLENLIRPIAVGRKNWLFAGSHDAAKWAGMFYSFFACCTLNGIDPHEWLLDVLGRIQDHPINRLDELLPHKWKKSDSFFDLEKLMKSGQVVRV